MVESVAVPPRLKPEVKPKVPLDMLVGKVIEYLTKHPAGETVDNLASNTGIPAATTRKILGIIVVVTSKVAPLYTENGGAKVRLLLTRSPKGTVTAARFEVPAPGQVEEDSRPAGSMGPKSTYIMGPTEVAEIQRVWKLYKATGQAFRREEATRLAPLCAKYPNLFTLNAAKTGILPTMALFTIAKVLEQYAALGRVPDAIETPVAIFTFEGGT